MISKEQEKLLSIYNKGLALYKKRKWNEACSSFEEALKIIPNDGPCKLYVERCKQYLRRPPSDDWDGVFIMTTK